MPLDLSLPPKLWLPPKPAIIRAWKREELKLGFIPGFLPPGAAAAKAALTTLTQVASATSLLSTVVGPAGILPGDLLVLLDFANSSPGLPTLVTPTDFTPIANTASATTRGNLSAKIAVGTEASATITGMSGTVRRAKMLYVFRGNVPISVMTPTDPDFVTSTSNPAAQTVTSSGGTPPLIVFGGYAESNGQIVDPRTFSTTKDGEINPATWAYLAYKIYNSSPVDVSIDMDDEGTNFLASCYIACS